MGGFMMRLHSSNPVYRGVTENVMASTRPVTYANVALKTVFLTFVTIGSGLFAVTQFVTMNLGLLIGAAILAFISVMIGIRNVKLAPFFSILYAICEGFILGLVSLAYSFLYEGIVPTALATTLIVLLVMMLLYSTNIIKVNQKFASFMVVALISVIIMSLLGLIVPGLGGGSFYVLICAGATLLSAFYLFLDFENIKICVENQADVSTGWVLALGLMVSLVWIYVEILRLLFILGNHRN
jgi:uncharacterized YccA/Bax inhibitor family protein